MADIENTQNPRQNVEEEIKRLKNGVASLKKDPVTPPQHLIPIRRQTLPAPQSKSSPHKIVQDSKNNQMKSKKLAKCLNLQRIPAKKTKIKNVLPFFQRTMQTLSTYERQFLGHLDIETTQTEI